MATITITKQWANGQILLEADLDFIKDDVETFLNVTKISDDNIQDSGITASSKLVDGTISTGKLQNAAITDIKLAADSVTTVKILDANVTTAKIADTAVTAAKLNSDVTTAFTPPGIIWLYSGSSAPSGWLLCDGSVVSQTTYAALYAVIGSLYNTSGEGAGNFRLPDLRGRVPAGKDDMGGGSPAGRLTNTTMSSATTLGGNGGAETHALTTAEMPSHAHRVLGKTGGPALVLETETSNVLGAQGGGSYTNTGPGGPIVETTGGPSSPGGTAGNGSAHTNTQPTLILNYIVKT